MPNPKANRKLSRMKRRQSRSRSTRLRVSASGAGETRLELMVDGHFLKKQRLGTTRASRPRAAAPWSRNPLYRRASGEQPLESCVIPRVGGRWRAPARVAGRRLVMAGKWNPSRPAPGADVEFGGAGRAGGYDNEMRIAGCRRRALVRRSTDVRPGGDGGLLRYGVSR